MLICHSWYDYKDNGRWPWASKKFWKVEIQLALLALFMWGALFAFCGKSSNKYWFWEKRDFYACKWAMSPSQVINTENLTGRPSSTVKAPTIKIIDDEFTYLHAKKEHLYPITEQYRRSDRTYFFINKHLIAGCTYNFYNDSTEEKINLLKDRIKELSDKYGEPVIKRKGKIKALIWNYDDASYYGRIYTVNKRYGYLTERRIYISRNIDIKKLEKFIETFSNSSV